MLPKSLTVSHIENQIKSKPYLKLHWQQNGAHDRDREKASSLVQNIIMKKLKKNESNLLFGVSIAHDLDKIEEEKFLDLAP